MYFVFGLLREGETIFIGRGDETVNLQRVMREHNATGVMFIVKDLTELEALGIEYQLIHDVKPIGNKYHSAYNGPSPWTYPDMLYKQYNIKFPGLECPV